MALDLLRADASAAEVRTQGAALESKLAQSAEELGDTLALASPNLASQSSQTKPRETSQFLEHQKTTMAPTVVWTGVDPDV